MNAAATTASKVGRAFPILHAALNVSLVILISSCLGDQRQDAVGDVDSNDL
jgi:hypothetical protein